MSFNSAPSPGNNENKIVKTYTPNLATDAPKRKREFDILRTALRKNPSKVNLQGEPLQKVDTSLPPKPTRNFNILQKIFPKKIKAPQVKANPLEPIQLVEEEQEKEELWRAVENEPHVQRELQQSIDEDKQRSLLEPILKKGWLNLLKESTKLDEATIQQNNALVEFLRGKNDPTSKKMLSELLQSTKVLQRMTAVNKAEIATATSDTSYWDDAYRKQQLEQPHESDIDQQKLSAESSLGRLRDDIQKEKKKLEHLGGLDQSEQGTIADIKKSKAALKALQNLLAAEETLLHPQKPYDQVYIQKAKAREGEIPVQREWEDTKKPETTS